MPHFNHTTLKYHPLQPPSIMNHVACICYIYSQGSVTYALLAPSHHIEVVEIAAAAQC